MAMLAPAMAAVGSSMFSVPALITAGASLGITAAQAMRKGNSSAPATPAAPPQPTKTPDRSAVASNNAAAAGPGGALVGNSGTFLTGPGGVDPTTLNLGKNTLLGQ